jgi:hypothetical protein
MIVAVVISLVLLGSAIAAQVAISSSAETSRLQASWKVWFGDIGFLCTWLLFMLLCAAAYFAPLAYRLLIPEIRLLRGDIRQTLQKVNEMTNAIVSLTSDVKKSTKLSELLQSGVNLATRAIAQNAPRTF